jgi:hypothetical protein
MTSKEIIFQGKYFASSKYLSVRSFVYLARRLELSPLPGDEEYEIGQQRVPLQDFDGLFDTSQLSDARVIAGLCLARHFLANHS